MKWKQMTFIVDDEQDREQVTIRYRTVKRKRVYQRKVFKGLDLFGGPIEETIDYLREQSEGLVDATVNSERVTSGQWDSIHRKWDNEEFLTVLRGWTSDVSEEMIAAVEKEINAISASRTEAQAQKKERAKKELERLLAQHPDLLED